MRGYCRMEHKLMLKYFLNFLYKLQYKICLGHTILFQKFKQLGN